MHAALADVFPEDGIIVLESPSSTLALRNRLRISRPGSYFFGAGGGLGFGLSAAVGVLLWLPPVVDQLRHTPGNLSMLSDYFRNPPEQAIGLRTAGRVFLEHLDVFRVVGSAVRRSDYFTSTALTISGPLWPGVIFLVL